MNVFIVTGRIHKDASVQTTADGKNVINFIFEEIRPNMKNQPPALYRCVAWHQTALELDKRCRQGRQFTMQGELKNSTNKDGIQEQKFDVKVFFEFRNITSEDIPDFQDVQGKAVSYLGNYDRAGRES